MFFLLQDADEDSVSQDLAVQSLKIYNIKANTAEDPDNIGIVVDGMKVLTGLGNFPRACSLLVGLAYAVNLAYPKELRCVCCTCGVLDKHVFKSCTNKCLFAAVLCIVIC